MTATQVSKSQCIELQTNPGYYLLKDAAYAWDRAVAAFGKQVLITGSWRSYETQERLFDGEKYPNQFPQYGRYLRGNRAGQRGFTTDVRWWPAKDSYWTRREGAAAAAVPGTSNHGGGVAVDVKTRREDDDPPYSEAVIFGSWTDADRTRFLRVAAEHGWDDDEGRSVNELWHLTYYPARDQHRGMKPTTDTPEVPDMDATQAKQLSDIHAVLTGDDRFLKVADGRYPVIDATEATGADAPKVTFRTGFKQVRLAVLGGMATTVAKAVVKELPDVDPAAVTKAVTNAVDKALADIEITLTKEN